MGRHNKKYQLPSHHYLATSPNNCAHFNPERFNEHLKRLHNLYSIGGPILYPYCFVHFLNLISEEPFDTMRMFIKRMKFHQAEISISSPHWSPPFLQVYRG